MYTIKTAFAICLQNLRKWRTDYRVWAIGILIFVIVLIYIDDIEKIADGLGEKMPIWIYPFLYSQFYTKLLFTLPIALLFCDAPFVDGNQLFVIMRAGRKKWLLGQMLYIVFASAIYYIFLLCVTLICTIYSGGELSMEWGITLTTTATTNAAWYFNAPFISISSVVTNFFEPLSAVWFTFLMSWLCGVLLGLIIFFCNMITGTKSLGVAIISLLIILSETEEKGLPFFVYFSPISWITLDKIDVGGYTSNPTFTYCMTVYLSLISILIALIFIFGRKKSLDVRG